MGSALVSRIRFCHMWVEFHKLRSVFHASVHNYFDNVMTKFSVNNKTDVLKTDNKLSNCPLPLVDASHKL